MNRAGVPVTDDDRQRVALDVQLAAGAGILTLAEADLRLREVWHAPTLGALDGINADLPRELLSSLRGAERQARAAVRARQELRRRIALRLGLAVLLVTIWLLTTPGGYFWPIWPILGTSTCLLHRSRRPAGAQPAQAADDRQHPWSGTAAGPPPRRSKDGTGPDQGCHGPRWGDR